MTSLLYKNTSIRTSFTACNSFANVFFFFKTTRKKIKSFNSPKNGIFGKNRGGKRLFFVKVGNGVAYLHILYWQQLIFDFIINVIKTLQNILIKTIFFFSSKIPFQQKSELLFPILQHSRISIVILACFENSYHKYR